MAQPELRFKEFTGDWENEALGKLCEITTGKLNANAAVDNGKYLFFTCAEKPYRIDTPAFNTEALLISGNGAHVGYVHYYKGEFNAYQRTYVLDKFKIDILYAKQFIDRNLSTRINQEKKAGNTPYIVLDTLTDMAFKIPSIKEQQKLSKFFNIIDQKLDLQSEKLDQLEQYRTGIMQQIFSKEIRFKDENGEDYPEWEEKKLGDTIDVKIDNRGKTPPLSTCGYPLIEIDAIDTCKVHYDNIQKYVDENTYKNWFRKHLQKGDIIFSTVGSTAQCAYYDEKVKSVIAQNIVGFRFKNYANSKFMMYLIIANTAKSIKKIEMNGLQPSIKVTQLLKIDFKVPSLQEQQKIANFLSLIDQRIETEKNKLNQLELLKKGLMQRMFV